MLRFRTSNSAYFIHTEQAVGSTSKARSYMFRALSISSYHSINNIHTYLLLFPFGIFYVVSHVLSLVLYTFLKVTTLEESPFSQFLYTSNLYIYYIPPSFGSSEQVFSLQKTTFFCISQKLLSSDLNRCWISISDLWIMGDSFDIYSVISPSRHFVL